MTEAPPHPEADVFPTAIRGDLTQGPILRTMMAFSLLMLATNLLQTFNASISAIWAGRLLGEAALAATANANLVVFLLYSVIFGLGNATTIRVGHFYGARDLDNTRRVFAGAIGFCTAMALVTGIAGYLAAEPILRMLAMPPQSLGDATIYLRVMFLTVAFGTIGMIQSMGLRGAGDSRTPLYGMVLTVVLTAGLNPLLILGFGPVPALGIAGSALATAVANFLGAILVFALVRRGDGALRLTGRDWTRLRPDPATMAYIVTKGVPMGATMLAVTGAGVIIIGLVNRQGLNAAAAYGAALQVWNYLQMPAFAIGTAVSAMAAQAIGAGDNARVQAISRVGMNANLVLTGGIAAAIMVLSRPILALFLGGESPAIPVGQHILYVCSWSFVLGSVVMIQNGTMRAYGEVMLPLLIIVVAMYPARVGSYFVLRPLIGEEAVWWSYPAGTIVNVVFSGLAYRWGRWRRRMSGFGDDAAGKAAR